IRVFAPAKVRRERRVGRVKFRRRRRRVVAISRGSHTLMPIPRGDASMSTRSLVLLTVAVLAVGGVAVLANRFAPAGFVFRTEAVNPVSRLDFPDDKSEFTFAIVSDRTGAHRANVFSQAVEKLNLMQPQFVVSVGDLIEGGGKQPLPDQWKSLQAYSEKLTMPFFYVPGNHDYKPGPKAKEWAQRFGKNSYHFVYRDVLMLMVCSEDKLAFI